MTALESIPLFQSLTTDELHGLRQIASGRQFKAGQEIFHEGAPGDGVYFVKEGLVEIQGRRDASAEKLPLAAVLARVQERLA